jgi:hypothetical protein
MRGIRNVLGEARVQPVFGPVERLRHLDAERPESWRAD